MTITYPVPLPDDLFGQFAIREKNTVGINTSAFTLRRNKQIYTGECWIYSASFVRLSAAEAGEIEGILSSLRGAQGECTIGDVLHATPRGEARLNPGTPTISGSGQKGYTLNIKECPISILNYLMAGDRIQIGPPDRPRLHKVLTNVDTDVAGTCTLDLWPILRNPIDDDPVFVLNPRGWFEMQGNDLEYLEDSPDLVTLNASFVESNL